MLLREIQNLETVALSIQQTTACSMQDAKAEAARLLSVTLPTKADFLRVLRAVPARRMRGKPRSERLSKRDAVAAVAVYFESGGIRTEQAIRDAKRWLGLSLSRRVAKAAVAAYKAEHTIPPDYLSAAELDKYREQFMARALWAYATYKPGTTLKLPQATDLTPGLRRRAIFDLG